jgi:hypothetical protein
MFTPGLAIFYSATILRPGHVCGVECHACGIVTWQSELSVGHELYPYCLRLACTTHTSIENHKTYENQT